MFEIQRRTSDLTERRRAQDLVRMRHWNAPAGDRRIDTNRSVHHRQVVLGTREIH